MQKVYFRKNVNFWVESKIFVSKFNNWIEIFPNKKSIFDSNSFSIRKLQTEIGKRPGLQNGRAWLQIRQKIFDQKIEAYFRN